MAGSTRLEMCSNGRLIRAAVSPARSAARMNNGGVSLLLTNGRPAVKKSIDWGECNSLHIASKASSSGSSCFAEWTNS